MDGLWSRGGGSDGIMIFAGSDVRIDGEAGEKLSRGGDIQSERSAGGVEGEKEVMTGERQSGDTGDSGDRGDTFFGVNISTGGWSGVKTFT